MNCIGKKFCDVKEVTAHEHGYRLLSVLFLDNLGRTAVL